jgi:hypothetical protein
MAFELNSPEGQAELEKQHLRRLDEIVGADRDDELLGEMVPAFSREWPDDDMETRNIDKDDPNYEEPPF